MTKWEANPYWNGALVDWYPMKKRGYHWDGMRLIPIIKRWRMPVPSGFPIWMSFLCGNFEF